MTITREEVLDTLQGMADDDDPEAVAAGDRFIIRDRIGENWDAGEGFWSAMGAIRCLELLGVEDAEERVDWFGCAILDPDDLVILANARFWLVKCDVCGANYHITSEKDEFLSTYCVTREGGWAYTSRSGKDIRICDSCSTTNKAVILFIS